MNTPIPRPANRFDIHEWAGAFGDLGTLIPFVAAYIAILKMNPNGILVAFNDCMFKKFMNKTVY